MTRPLGRLEVAAAALTLFMFAEALLPRLLAPEVTTPGEAPESTLLRYLWLPFYGLVGIGLLLSWRDAWRAIVASPWLILLSALAIISAGWSIDPELSLRRGIAVTATTLLGIYIAVRFDWIGALRLLGGVWFALMLASLIAGVVAPSFAVMSEIHPGAWSGAWGEKNQLGGHAARAAFLFAFLAWRDAGYRKTWSAALIVSLALVALSTSVTALLATLLSFGVLVSAWWMLKGRTWSLTLLWGAASVIGIGILVYVAAPGALLGLIGRDASLTGRTDIWAELITAIGERPILGYGYLAFWGLDSEPRYWLARAVDWNAPSGHNGWLDLAISLGLAGVVIYAIDFVVSAWRAVKLATISPTGVFAIGFLAQFMLFAMSESVILAQNSILWATVAMISTKLALDARKFRDVPPPFPGEAREGASSATPTR